VACCITSLKNVNNEWNCVDAHSTERPADATRARETSREMSTAALATLAIPRGLRACLRAGLASRHRASGRRLRPASLAAAADDGGSGKQQPLDAVRAIETASDTQRNDLAVVLVTPQIPGNTGTIARTCAASQGPAPPRRPARLRPHRFPAQTRGPGLLEQRLRQGPRRLGRLPRVLARYLEVTRAPRRL
jgi:hypothetical protein